MKTITADEYQALRNGATVLAADAFGDKVLRTPRGEILKLFRRKRLWSSALLRPYASRFARNAALLHAQGIATVEVLGAYRVPAIERDIVVYRELPGRSLREALQDEQSGAAEKSELLARCGALIGALHARGILFRSIHFANILISPDGTLALIDVADLRARRFGILRGALRSTQRMRNFRHMLRYETDRAALRTLGTETFIAGYLPQCGIAPPRLEIFAAALKARLEALCRPQK